MLTCSERALTFPSSRSQPSIIRSGVLGLPCSSSGVLRDPIHGLAQLPAIVARPDPGYDRRLRALYAERMQWDEVLQVLSETAVDAVRDLDEFDAGFTGPGADELSVSSLRPKMSTVVYDTTCEEWNPHTLAELFNPEDVLAGAYAQ